MTLEIERRSSLPRQVGLTIYPLNSPQKVPRQILRLHGEDPHLETKRSYEGPPLLSGLRREQHRRTLASEWDEKGHWQEFLKICEKVAIWLGRHGCPMSATR
jgi:hypothetical protein